MKPILILLSLLICIGQASADDAQILRDARTVVARTLPGKERDALTAALDLLTSRLRSPGAPASTSQSSKPSNAHMSIPPEVVAQIRANAAKEYANNFALQVITTDTEICAYDKLRHYELLGASGVPPDVMAKIISKVKAENKGKYSLCVIMIESEVSSYRRS